MPKTQATKDSSFISRVTSVAYNVLLTHTAVRLALSGTNECTQPGKQDNIPYKSNNKYLSLSHSLYNLGKHAAVIAALLQKLNPGK